MKITLTPELEQAIRAKVQSGLYRSPGEVVREALRRSLLWDQGDQWLAREAAIGHAQLQAGDTVQIESKEHFVSLLRNPA